MLGRKRTAGGAFVGDQWLVVEDAVKCVLSGRRSSASFQCIYQCVFQLCQAKHGQELAHALEELFDTHVATIVATIGASDDDELLETVTEQLRQYRSALEKLDSLLLFYNRSVAQSCHKPTVQQIGENIVGNALFTSVSFLARLNLYFCARISDEAFCSTVEGYSYEIVLLDSGKWVKVAFESPFLEALVKRYTAESSRKQSYQIVEEYLSWVHTVVDSETQRVLNILNAAFADRVQDTLEDVLVTQQREFLLKGPGGVDEELHKWNIGGLRVVMDALASVGEEDTLTEEIARSVTRIVRSILAGSMGTSTSPHLIEHIADLVEKTNLVVSGITKASNRARVLRAVEEAVNGCAELPDLLSSYVDHAMRMSAGKELECAMDHSLTVFRVIRDKDIFEASYRNYLAARLMHASPEVIRIEKVFIAKLKAEGSAAHVARLDGMLVDVEASAAVNQRIAEEINAGAVTLPIEFQVAVLTTAFWPTLPSTIMQLPREMEMCRSFFTVHYLRRHNGRKLLFNFNTGNIAFTLRMPLNEYAVIVPTLYAHTISALNSDADITPESLMVKSSLPNSELTSQLAVLDQVGLVVKSTSGAYHFNEAFSSQRPRIKISAAAAAKVASPAAIHSFHRSGGVHDSRISSLDAVIVKRLKKERTLHHDALCELVAQDLRHIFKPTTPDIKARLTSLIERGFVTRSTADGYYIYCQ